MIRDRTGGRLRRPWAAASGLALALGILATGGAAQATTTEPTESTNAPPSSLTFKFLQFNMAGAAENEGETGVARDVVNSMVDGRPDFVTLNEVCWQQFDYIRDRMNSRGFEGSYGYTLTEASGCDGHSYGNAIFVRGSSTWAGKTWLPGGAERRNIFCVDHDSYQIVVCATHIDHRRNKDEQTAKVRAVMAEHRNNGDHTLVGGDFNVRPTSIHLDPIYHICYQDDSAGRGFMHEVDAPGWCDARGGEATHSEGKLDYLFVTPGWDDIQGDATHASRSDHDPLWGYGSLTYSEAY